MEKLNKIDRQLHENCDSQFIGENCDFQFIGENCDC